MLKINIPIYIHICKYEEINIRSTSTLLFLLQREKKKSLSHSSEYFEKKDECFLVQRNIGRKKKRSSLFLSWILISTRSMARKSESQKLGRAHTSDSVAPRRRVRVWRGVASHRFPLFRCQTAHTSVRGERLWRSVADPRHSVAWLCWTDRQAVIRDTVAHSSFSVSPQRRGHKVARVRPA